MRPPMFAGPMQRQVMVLAHSAGGVPSTTACFAFTGCLGGAVAS